jgi:hypothetical protein
MVDVWGGFFVGAMLGVLILFSTQLRIFEAMVRVVTDEPRRVDGDPLIMF